MNLGFFGWCFVLLNAAVQAMAMQQRILPVLLVTAVGPALYAIASGSVSLEVPRADTAG